MVNKIFGEYFLKEDCIAAKKLKYEDFSYRGMIYAIL